MAAGVARAGRVFYASAVPDSAITVPSFAKINLHLRVAGRRDDGFHEVCTVFQTISLHDTLAFGPGDAVTLTCDRADVPTGEDNLIVKAAGALQARFGVSKGAAIHLEKRIPSPGGLGGGSSNAAVTLLALSKLWEINAETTELHGIAEQLGSDVPFFLYGGTCLGTGRGTEIAPLPELAAENVIIVTPDADISTREAFGRLNARSLTKYESNRILQICRFEAESRLFDNTALINDFEESVFSTHPEVKKAKDTLTGLGAAKALLSGSGASVFGIFDKDETRQAALKALDQHINWRKFAVAAISRDTYREALKQVY